MQRSASEGKKYYVSPLGSDANSGTEKSPFRSIQRAADAVNPGDAVIVRKGVYTSAGKSDEIVNLDRGGTPSRWVVFRSEERWGAVIDGRNNTTPVCWNFGKKANYVRVEGFEVKGCRAAGFNSNAGAHNIYISGNNIHDIGRLCTSNPYGQDGIYVGTGTQDNYIEGNYIHDIGRLPCGTPFDYNHDHGVYIKGSRNCLIAGNVFYRNLAGWAIHLYGGIQTGIRITNNTFAFPNPRRDGHIILDGGSTNIIIENNLFYRPSKYAVVASSCNDGNRILISNNISTAGIAKDSDCGIVVKSNLSNTNPGLANPGRLDFRLKRGSPAIGRGTVNGTKRYDIGAFQYSPGAVKNR